MREIKYRQITKKGIHYWGYIDGFFVSPLTNADNSNIPSDQYTGLKDRNDKEIYERDIVNYGDNYPSVVKFGFNNGENQGFYLEELDKFEDIKKEHTLFCQTNPIEIIGNIYKNPELLK